MTTYYIVKLLPKMSAKHISSGFSSQKKTRGDRFIPHSVAKALFTSGEKGASGSHYQEMLNRELFAPKITPKILRFVDEQDQKENSNPNQGIFRENGKKVQRLPQEPYRTLHAPMLKDDFYLNLLDWSETGHIAAGLHSSLYLWSGCATRVSKVQDYSEEGESICAVNFQPTGNRVALGLYRGDMALFDIEKQRE